MFFIRSLFGGWDMGCFDEGGGGEGDWFCVRCVIFV